MPVSKNAYLRYRIIDECLNNKSKAYHADALLEIIARKTDHRISKDMLHKDMDTTRRELEAPIVYDRSKNCYRYSKSFTLSKITLSDEEAEILDSSISVLSLLKGTPFLKKYENIISKLEVGRQVDTERNQFIQVELSSSDNGMEWFDPLYHFISEKKTVVLSYQGFEREINDYTISPYLLKEYRNRWYLVGYSALTKQIKTFALDRLKKISESISPYHSEKSFKAFEYFKHSFGITRINDEVPVDLVLEFSKTHIPYVLSQPLHLTQKTLEQTTNSLKISMHIYQSYELDMCVLSYGAGVKVISPVWYRKKIKNIIEEMKKLY